MWTEHRSIKGLIDLLGAVWDPTAPSGFLQQIIATVAERLTSVEAEGFPFHDSVSIT